MSKINLKYLVQNLNQIYLFCWSIFTYIFELREYTIAIVDHGFELQSALYAITTWFQNCGLQLHWRQQYKIFGGIATAILTYIPHVAI
jgi:hypothetical protein